MPVIIKIWGIGTSLIVLLISYKIGVHAFGMEHGRTPDILGMWISLTGSWTAIVFILSIVFPELWND